MSRRCDTHKPDDAVVNSGLNVNVVVVERIAKATRRIWRVLAKFHRVDLMTGRIKRCTIGVVRESDGDRCYTTMPLPKEFFPGIRRSWAIDGHESEFYPLYAHRQFCTYRRACQMALHRRRQPPYPLSYLLWSRIRKIQPHMPSAFDAVVRIERISRHKRNVLFERGVEYGLHVQAFGQSYPEEQTALGMSPGDGGWEEFLQRLQHHVAAFGIHLANQLYVLVEESIARHFVGHELRERRSVQVGALLQLRQLADNLRRRDDPSQPQPGSQRLRKRAQVNDVANGIPLVAAQVLAVKHDQRWKMLAFIAQLAVRIVFDNRNPIAVRQQHQFVAPSL